MEYIKEQTLTKSNFLAVAQFLIISSVAIILPFLVHIQWLTGPIVNAALILALFLTGIRSALLLCLIPSMMALSGGLLPSILAPVVPFIMLSNTIFVLLIDYFYDKTKSENIGYWVGVLVAASAKFLFLFLSINVISGLLIKQELAVKVVQMMSWPQFFTAIAGGIIAWAFLKGLKKV